MAGSGAEGKDLDSLDRVEPITPLSEAESRPAIAPETRNYWVNFDPSPIDLLWLPALLVVVIVELSLGLPAVVVVLSVAALAIAFLVAWSRFRTRE